MYEDDLKRAQTDFDNSKVTLERKLAEITDHEAAIANGTAVNYNMSTHDANPEYGEGEGEGEYGEAESDERDEM